MLPWILDIKRTNNFKNYIYHENKILLLQGHYQQSENTN